MGLLAYKTGLSVRHNKLMACVYFAYDAGAYWNSPLLAICCRTYCDDTTGLKGTQKELYIRLVTGSGEPTSGGAGGPGSGSFPDDNGDGFPDDLPDDAVVWEYSKISFNSLSAPNIEIRSINRVIYDIHSLPATLSFSYTLYSLVR